MFKYILYETFLCQLCDRINKRLCTDQFIRENIQKQGKHSGTIINKSLDIFSYAADDPGA